MRQARRRKKRSLRPRWRKGEEVATWRGMYYWPRSQPPSSGRLTTVLLQEPFYESRIDLPCPEIGVGQDLPVQRDRGIYTLDDKHLQRPCHARARLVAVFRAHDQFRNQRI